MSAAKSEGYSQARFALVVVGIAVWCYRETLD
jgi:hypothetical protein